MVQPGRKWVLFQLHEQTFGLEADRILEMVIAKNIHESPLAPPHVRGVMRLRDDVFPVVDTRLVLGMKGKREEVAELVEMLEQRQQDHVNWIVELRNSVEEDREFKLTNDPHKCAFGKWYDQYEPETAQLRMQFEKFDQPHQAIHHLADTVAEKRTVGDSQGALAVVDRAWNTLLHAMIELFEETRNMLREGAQEIVLVASCNDGKVGLLVDVVDELRDLEVDDIQDSDPATMGDQTEYVRGFTHFGDDVMVLVDLDKIADGVAGKSWGMAEV